MKKRNYCLLMLIALISFGLKANAQLQYQPVPVCIGATITPGFVSTISTDYPDPLATWTSSNPSIASIAVSSGAVTGNAVGTVIITYTYNDVCGNGPKSYYAYVSVVPNTVSISGPSSVCSGSFSSPISLTASVGGGSWSATYGYVGVDPYGNVTGLSIGTDIISYTVFNACGILSAASTVTAKGTVGDIFTIAGDGTIRVSGDHGQSIIAGVRGARGMTTDPAGNLYICDVGTNTVRKITPSGVITTIAGTGYPGNCGEGVPGIQGELNVPRGCCFDNAGNLYIVSVGAQVIRKVDPTGKISTFAGTVGVTGSGNGYGTSAYFSFPDGICFDAPSNALYVIDAGNDAIRKIDLSTVYVSTIFTDGSWAGGAKDIAVDNNANLYITDFVNNQIEAYNYITTSFTTIAGSTAGTAGNTGDGGPGTAALLNGPSRLAFDGNYLYFSDQVNNRFRFIDLTAPTPVPFIYAFAGTGMSGPFGADGNGGPALGAEFGMPANSTTGVAVGNAGNVFLADGYNREIREVVTKGSIAITGYTDACAYTGRTFTASVSTFPGVATYQWMDNGLPIAGASGTIVPGTPITYTNTTLLGSGDVITCQINVTYGCPVTYPVVSNGIVQGCPGPPPGGGPAGIHGTSGSGKTGEFSVTPNPTSGTLNISGTFSNTSSPDATVEVLDLNGKVLFTDRVPLDHGAMNKNITLSSSIANGVYLIKVINGADSKVNRFTLER